MSWRRVMGWVGHEDGVEYLGENAAISSKNTSSRKVAVWDEGGGNYAGNPPLHGIGAESVESSLFPNEEYVISGNGDGEGGESIRIASPASCCFNLVNNIIGGGVLALPFALKTSGLLVGPILLISVGLLSAYSAFLLLLAGKKIDSPSYRSLADNCFGRYGALIVDCCMVLFLFGALTGYMIIIGDVLTPFMDFLGKLETREFVVAMVAIFIMLPLCLLPRIDYLKYASLGALFCIAYIVIVITLRGAEDLGSDKSDAALVPSNFDVLESIPIISFAFTFHASIFPLFSEMRRPTLKRVGGVIIGANMICASAYLVVAIFGYLTFLEDTEGNIFDNYVDDDVLEAGKAVLAIVIILSYPLIHYPARIHLNNIFTATIGEEKLPEPWMRHVAIPFIYVGASYVLSIIIPDITVVFGFVGATAGNAIVFILPGIMYTMLTKPALPQKCAALGLSILGAGIGLGSCIVLTIALLSLLVHGDDSKVMA